MKCPICGIIPRSFWLYADPTFHITIEAPNGSEKVCPDCAKWAVDICTKKFLRTHPSAPASHHPSEGVRVGVGTVAIDCIVAMPSALCHKALS